MAKETATPRPKQSSEQSGGFKFTTAIFLFLGTFFGSLIGAAADFGSAIDSVGRLQEIVNPPPQLCIAGSNTILGDGIQMASDWKAEFETLHRVDISVEGVGSVRGVELAAEGECVNLLAMSEPMTSAQYQRLTDAGVSIDCAAEIGYDVIAFVTDINNPVNNITLRYLPAILNGEITNWSEFPLNGPDQPIFILARPGSGTTEVVLLNVARFMPTEEIPYPVNATYLGCPSNEACLDTALSTPGSLYWVSTAWMHTQPEEYLRVIAILRGDERAVNPLTEEVNLDQYPRQLIRPLYMYVLNSESASAESRQLARLFLEYVRGVRGQQVLESYHFYTHFDRPAEIELTLPDGFGLAPNRPAVICQ